MGIRKIGAKQKNFAGCTSTSSEPGIKVYDFSFAIQFAITLKNEKFNSFIIYDSTARTQANLMCWTQKTVF